MKETLKKHVKRIVAPVRLYWGYMYDYRRFLKSSFDFNKNKLTKDNLRGEIAFEYHAIEKGLSHENLRLGFGKARVQRLLYLLNEWKKHDYQLTDTRFITGIAVIEEYISVHKKNSYNVDKIQLNLEELLTEKNPLSKQVAGGALEISKSDFLTAKELEFERFSKSRRSIRNYGEEKISNDTLVKAIELAQNAPSVCNRQTSKVYVIKNQETIKQCLIIQNGIQGMAENISALLVVTSDNQYFGNINERNQSFVDGGLYAMNLLYSLTYNGVATCSLNANLNTKAMEKLRKILSISKSEDFIMFISCGSYPDKCRFPVSCRDNVSEVMTIID